MAPERDNKNMNKQDAGVTKRLERLRQWKEQKIKKIKEEKARRKPVFKVTHISPKLGMPDLKDINKVIKGKLFKTRSDVERIQLKHQFAPKNYQFNGPSTSKALNLLEVPNNQHHYDLRSRKVFVNKKDEKTVMQSCASKSKKNVRKRSNSDKANASLVPQEPHEIIQSVFELSEDSPNKQDVDTLQNNFSPASTKQQAWQAKTPESKNIPVTYISPFVTICRGKNSARKEFHHRKSRGGLFNSSPDLQNSTGPKAGAAYFHKLLDGEISRIQGLCDDWQLYKKEQDPPEEACDMINVAIGQSQLLLEKKFKQFRNLINSCDSGNSDMPITCEDLHGYWDTAYIQVENLNQRFDNLVKQRSNNWEEILPEKKTVVVKKATKPKPEAQASSSIRDAIKAARNKAKAHVEAEDCAAETNTFDGVFFSIQSPQKLQNLADLKSENRSSSKKRKSLLPHVLSMEGVKRESLPGLIMWKTAQAAKSIEKKPISTPGRSILKVRRSKSGAKRRPKSVLFTEEKIRNAGKSILLTPEDDTSRKRLRRRMTRTKLF